ncbi:hypothetical protein N7474_000928 [Penicillium riverlandense]|uniref:uncharacterized protein n=1 Tax=Penicillium riverlandense TaxID=1903569 RepID=UPI0025494A76|nr:uncharacterized protein N7474_000928 [Penicillium riverlandense]KAJ5832617.1 hypothetical protein N7474_000928 [Penicillium riverlandense]
MLPIFLNILPLLSLFGFVLATPSRTHVVIGYRNVVDYKAHAYNEAGTLVWFPASSFQLGDVVYLSTGPRDWPYYPWFCIIEARIDKWAKVPKIWIPKYDDCGNFLWDDEEAIENYITDLGYDPEKTVRIAEIHKLEDFIQTALPEGLLNSEGGGLDLRAQCFDGWKKLPAKDVVPWYDWDIVNHPDDYSSSSEGENE